MKKHMFFPLLTLAGGAGAFVLRLLQRLAGFEAATVQNLECIRTRGAKAAYAGCL